MNPSAAVNLVDPAGGLTPSIAGFAPTAGTKDLVFTGRTSRRDGQRLVASSRDNAIFSLRYNIHTTTGYSSIMALQAPITELLEAAEDYELYGVGEPVFLEYGWGTNGLTVPVVGQLNEYCRIKAFDIVWPDSLMGAALIGGTIEQIEITLYCEPYAEGIRREAITTLQDSSGFATTAAVWADDVYTVAVTVTAPNPLVDFAIFQIWNSSTTNLTLHYDVSASQIDVTYNGTVDANTTLDSISIVADQTFSFVWSYKRIASPDDRKVYAFLDGTLIADTGNNYSITGVVYDIDDFGTPIFRPGTANSSGSPTPIFAADADSVTFATVVNGALKTEGDVSIFLPAADATINAPIITLSNSPIENDEGNNYIYVENVPGDAPAITEWQITPPTSNPSQAYWLGVRAVEGSLSDPEMFWHEFSGTVVSGTSGGQLEALSSSSKGEHSIAVSTDVDKYQGRYQVLAHTRTTTSPATWRPFYRFGTSSNANMYGPKTTTELAAGSLRFIDLGEIFIRWPGTFDDHEPSQIVLGVETEPTTGTSVRDVDFLLFLPYPFFRVSAVFNVLTIASGEKIVVLESDSWKSEAGNDVMDMLEVRGKAELVPGKRNYVYLYQGADEASIDVTDTGTVAVYVTPRYQLPGIALF